MPNASGVAKLVAAKKETVWGVAPGTGSAKYLRRVSSDLAINKAIYESNEIRSDYQDAVVAHGVRQAGGALDGELSPGSYQDFFAAALRRLFAAVTAVSGVTLTVAAGAGNTWTITRSTGDWLTSGIKIHSVVRITAGAVNALNLNKNVFIVALTATVMTVLVMNGSVLFAEGPIASCTVTHPGMKTYAPLTGHTDESFAIEHWFSDVAQSELFLGMKVQQIDVNLPPTGICTIKITFMGKDMTPNTVAYFVTPTAASAVNVVSAVNGSMAINGSQIAMLTGLSFSIAGGMTGEPVVGSNSLPEIFEGRVRVSGQATAFFQDATLRDAFLNETEVAIGAALANGGSANSEFLAFSFPRAKLNGSAKNDGERGLVQTIPFRALLGLTGGSGFAHEQTSMSMQDSLAV